MAACLLGLVAASLAALAPRADAQATSDWPQFQGSPDHSGIRVSADFEPPLRRAWRFDDVAGRSGVSGAVIAGSEILAVGEDAVYRGDIRTGSFQSFANRAGGPIAPPAVGSVGRALVVYTEGDSKSGPEVVARDLESGEERWTQPLKEPSGSGVTIDGDQVFVGDRDGDIYSFDLATGDPESWSPKALGGGAIEAPPAAYAGQVVVVTRTRDTGAVRVTALDENDGTENWHFSTQFASGTGSAVAIGGDRVFFGLGSELQLHAVSSDLGHDVWTARTRSSFSPLGAPVDAGGRLFVVSTSTSESALYAFDESDGSKLWDFQFQEPSIRSSPVVVGDTVYVGVDDGRVVGIDTGTGIEVWEDHTGPGPIGPLAVSGDLLVASKRGHEGGLIAYEHDRTGRLLHVESPTVLKMGSVLARFGIAFAAVFAVVFGLASLFRRAPIEAGPEDEPEAEPASEEEG